MQYGTENVQIAADAIKCIDCQSIGPPASSGHIDAFAKWDQRHQDEPQPTGR